MIAACFRSRNRKAGVNLSEWPSRPMLPDAKSHCGMVRLFPDAAGLRSRAYTLLRNSVTHIKDRRRLRPGIARQQRKAAGQQAFQKLKLAS